MELSVRTGTSKPVKQSLEGRAKIEHRADQMNSPKSTLGMSEATLFQTGRNRISTRSTKGEGSRVDLTDHMNHMWLKHLFFPEFSSFQIFSAVLFCQALSGFLVLETDLLCSEPHNMKCIFQSSREKQ